MTDIVAFAFAVFVVLATPGPTNTLLATATATTPFRRCLSLLPAEAIGYLISIGLLLFLVRPIAETSTAATIALRIISACYLVYLAVSLWGTAVAEPGATGPVRFRHVIVTTLLNPKAVIFAFVIFPDPGSPDWVLLRAFAVFVAIVAVCCTGWLSLGATIGKGVGGFVTPRLFQRGAAVVLGSFAAAIFVSVIRLTH